MAIEVVCQCGKVFRARDEYAGRGAICPACKREFVIEVHVLKPPILEPAVDWNAIATVPRLQVKEEPPAKSDLGHRPFWKDPIIVVGTAIPSLILLVFVAYLTLPGRTPPGATAAIVPNQPNATAPVIATHVDEADLTIGHKLASLEAGRELPLHNPTAETIDRLLTEADRLYAEDLQAIAELAHRMHELISKDNQIAVYIEILEGSTRWQRPGYFGRGRAIEFKEYLKLYLLLRLGRFKNHDEAIENCRHLSRSLMIPLELMTEDRLTELLNSDRQDRDGDR